MHTSTFLSTSAQCPAVRFSPSKAFLSSLLQLQTHSPASNNVVLDPSDSPSTGTLRRLKHQAMHPERKHKGQSWLSEKKKLCFKKIISNYCKPRCKVPLTNVKHCAKSFHIGFYAWKYLGFVLMKQRRHELAVDYWIPKNNVDQRKHCHFIKWLE